MDAQARKKALFRAKLSAQKKDKRIESPLVRYNEFDQPVCRVCDVVLKSDSQWEAHQASRKHHEAISKIKANAAGLAQVSNAKPEPTKGLAKSRLKPEHSLESQTAKPEPSIQMHKPQRSTGLPPDFFENSGKKVQKTGNSNEMKALESLASENDIDELSGNSIVHTNKVQPSTELTKASAEAADSKTKQVKGALPEGFFDSKEADLRARGIKIVKPDVKDEYKEFEKLIQDDLKEVDDRFEEEEIDAAETIEEAETLEQKSYRERVEMLKKKKMELAAARSSKRSKVSEEVVVKEPEAQESSSDDDSDENFTVDWRAQHM